MYQDHFGLYTAPFVLGPRLQFVFKSKTFEETMAHLIYGIEGGEEIILITGAIGTGKTLALQNLVAHIAATYRVALVNVTKVDFRELLKLALAELDVTAAEGADRADLLHALKLRLAALAKEGRRCLLVVDEAQNLDSDTLEGVRLLTNMTGGDSTALQVVLSGQPSLRDSIEAPELLQLRQRIRVHYHLSTLDEQETRQYIEHRMSVAGAERPVFKTDAIREIHRLSRGVPRLINILADKALLSAFVDGAREVSARHVEADASLVVSPEPRREPGPEPRPSPPPVRREEAAAVNERPAADGPRARRRNGIWWIPPLVLMLAGLVWLAVGNGSPLRHMGESEVAESPASAMETESENASARTVPEPVAEPAPAAAEAAPPPAEEAETDVAGETEAAGVGAGGSALVDSTAAHPAIDDALAPGVYVHIGSFRSLPRANSYTASLADNGFDAFLKRVTLSGVVWYRVYLGPFSDYEEADAVDARLHGENLSAWSMVVRIN